MATLLSGIVEVQANLNKDLLMRIEKCEKQGSSNSLRIEKCERQGTHNSKEVELLEKKITSELSRYFIKADEKIPYVFSAPPRNRYFAARNEEILELKRILKVEETLNEKKVGVAAVWGLGGVGKTSLVSEYAHQMKDFYKGGVYWISAEDDTFLKNTLNDIALKIGAFLDSFDLTLSNIFKKISNANDPSLIVLDCLDQQILSPNMMKFLSFPSQENIFGHFVILTRRNPNLLVNEISILEEDSCLQLKCFLSKEAKHFLFLRTGVTCDETVESVAESLCVELGRLPLALEQAGACIKILGCGLSSYLEQYRGARLKLLSQQKARSAAPGNESPERLAVHTTWCINMKHMKKSPNGQAAVTFMNACSFFNANEIEEELINVGTPEVEDLAFRQCMSSPLGCRQVLKLLTDFSLFTFVEANSVSTHRLVQELVRENLEREAKGKSFSDAVRMLSYAFSKCPSPSGVEQPSGSHSYSEFCMWSKLCLHGHSLRGIMEDLLGTFDSTCLEPAWCSATVKILYECAVHLSANHKQEEAKSLLNFAYRILDWLPVAEYEMIKAKFTCDSLFPLDIPLPKSLQIEIMQCCMRPYASLQPLTQKRGHETIDFDLEKKIEELRLDGNTNFEEGRYKEALHAYSSAINLAKDCNNAFNPLLLTNRAMVHIKLKQYEDAVKDANDYITLRPNCWKGHARKALALDGLNEKVSAEIAASVAFYYRRDIFSDFRPFKESFLGLRERISICDSVYELRDAILSSCKVTLSALKILVLGSEDYIFNSDVVDHPDLYISNCILVGTRRNRFVSLKLEGILSICLLNMCMVTNLSFYCNEGLVHCLPGSFIKFLNCYFTNPDGTDVAAVVTEGELNVEQCEFTNSKSGGLLCIGPGNTVVVDSSFCNNGKGGLQVNEGGSLRVKNSRILMNGQQGLIIGRDAAKCVAINCDIHQNDREGIVVFDSKDVTLIQNNVFGNYMNGIAVNNSEADIKDNNVFDNGMWGICSEGNSRCNILANRVFRNKVGGVRVGFRAAGKFTPSVVERNKIYDNIGPGFVENVHDDELEESFHTNEDLKMTYNRSKSSLQPAKCKDNEVENNKENENVVKPNLSIPYCSNCRVKCAQKRCGRCFTAAYCNKTCQSDHWSKHKELCQVLLEKSSFVITSMDKIPYKKRTERVEGKTKIGKMFSPPPRDGRRFVVKVHNEREGEIKSTNSFMVLYDRSLELYGKFASKYIYELVKEFGAICERKFMEKKLFLYCLFEKNGQPRLFTNEFAEFQDW